MVPSATPTLAPTSSAAETLLPDAMAPIVLDSDVPSSSATVSPLKGLANTPPLVTVMSEVNAPPSFHTAGTHHQHKRRKKGEQLQFQLTASKIHNMCNVADRHYGGQFSGPGSGCNFSCTILLPNLHLIEEIPRHLKLQLMIKKVNGRPSVFWKEFMRDKIWLPEDGIGWPVFKPDVDFNLSSLSAMPTRPVNGLAEVDKRVHANFQSPFIWLQVNL
ncbi:TPA: hypothetical protein ACH3X1_009882 [Trebouxia sp. C0004]